MADLNGDLNNQDDTIKDLDLKAIIAKLINYWYLFLISIIICVAIAIVKGNLTPPIWKITGKILVEEDDDNPSSSSSGPHSELSALLVPKHNIGNEVEIIRSRGLISQLVEENNFNIKTYAVLRFKAIEIFSAPFNIKLNYRTEAFKSKSYLIHLLQDDQYQISNKEENIDLKAHFGETVKLGSYDITLTKKDPTQLSGSFRVDIESEDSAVNELLKEFSVTADKTSATIALSYNYTHPQKGEEILEKLIKKYVAASLQNKIASMDSTIKFINGRLDVVSSELDTVQRRFVKFKQDNQIVDIVDKSGLVGLETNYSTNLVQQNIQIAVVNDLQKYLNRPGNTSIPSPVGLTNGVLSAGIDSYNTLAVSKEKLRLSLTDDNPVMENLNKQLESTRKTLISSLETYKRNLVIGRDQLAAQDNLVKDKLKDVPDLQRIYLDYKRQQSLKEDLYLFLLQKREEVSISRTSTISNARVLEHAKAASEPFEPKKAILILVGLMAGILIPAAYLGITEFFNTTLMSKYDIERRTTIPIIGEIGHKSDKDTVVVTKTSRSNISEQFRSFRTNLQYVLNSNKSNVIMFTSSMSGEGKTFLSLNLGSALGLAGKKVIFLELDLRKPKFSFNLGIDNTDGFTNYVVGDNVDYHAIIKKTEFNENCFLISSGPIPPNPSELLMHTKLERLIDDLRKEYDYIIIDTAPVGLVTDALLIEKLVDVTFYVTRLEYTHKLQLEMVNNLRQSGKINNIYMVINDVIPKKGNVVYGYGYGYGTGYGYGYGYGYGAQETKPGFWKRLFGKGTN